MGNHHVGCILVPPLIIVLLAVGATYFFGTENDIQHSHAEYPQHSAITELIDVSIDDAPKQVLNLEETITKLAQHSALATNRSRLVCSVGVSTYATD